MNDEIHIALNLKEGQETFTRAELGELVAQATAQAYRQGYVDRSQEVPAPQPSEHMQ